MRNARRHRKGISIIALVITGVFVAVTLAITALLSQPLILVILLGIPLAYWRGRIHERDIQNLRHAGHAMRQEQSEVFETDAVSAYPPEYTERPEWLGPDGRVIPLNVTEYEDMPHTTRESNSGPGHPINPDGPNERREQILRDPRSGVRDIRKRNKGPHDAP
jgi:hypothetical protein